MNEDCCILNAGGGAWAFQPLADALSDALWIDVAEAPRACNYLLLADDEVASEPRRWFVDFGRMQVAADKRSLASVFAEANVATPRTRLVASLEEARAFAASAPQAKWCLKYPTGCGASGHRMLASTDTLPAGWPTPLVVQEFIEMDEPEVYRIYAAGGETFGWVARRFPSGVRASPWVAHARGARYADAGVAPAEATHAARQALAATGLLEGFGCADLIRDSAGRWLVLEVGTDGMFNHVDRDLGLPDVEREINRRIAEAFWGFVGRPAPWQPAPWRPRSER
jgi:glutathione synthase/RimK-type ligase-like ATP-grasp enzyme